MKSSILKWFNTNKSFLIIIGLAFLVRFYFLSIALSMIGLENLSSASTDSVNYLKMADWLMGANIAYPEGRFFDWGIGHASWLVWILYLFKSNLAILIIQIILSSISCGLIYKLTMELLNNKIIAVIASLLLVFSATSINLSVLILSDTLYFFLMLLGLYYFIIGIRKNQWKYFILAGCFTGYAVLVRSIGQFWLFALILIGLVLIKNQSNEKNWIALFRYKKNTILKIFVSILITVLLMSSWIMHNYNKYDIPTLAFSSARGPANVCAYTEARLTGKTDREIKLAWIESYKADNNITYIPYDQMFRLYQFKSKEYFSKHPWETMRTYFSISWENITNINMLHRITFPKLKQETYKLESLYQNNLVKYLNVLLSLLGLIILLIKREYIACTILGLTYSYYFLMIGAIRWQGSRLFYPGQMAALILIAVAIHYILKWLKNIIIKSRNN